jgi:hypothetical protein
VSVTQAIGSCPDRPAYKELEQLVTSARQAGLEIFRIARVASSLDREAVRHISCMHYCVALTQCSN